MERYVLTVTFVVLWVLSAGGSLLGLALGTQDALFWRDDRRRLSRFDEPPATGLGYHQYRHWEASRLEHRANTRRLAVLTAICLPIFVVLTVDYVTS